MSTSRAQVAQPVPHAGKTMALGSPSEPGAYTRWRLLHESHKLTMGELYSSRQAVEAALTPRDDHIPKILDVGTGSGIWAVDMANKFPQCEVIGIDIVAPRPIPSQPSNLRFEIMDIALPLPLETASVDFIYARLMDIPINDYPKWLSEISRILRPNGVYQALSSTFRTVQEDGTDVPTVLVGEEGYTGLQSLLSAFCTLMPQWRSALPMDQWTRWMTENGNFDSVEKERLLVPLGPWQSGINENTRKASDLMRQCFLVLVTDLKPMLLNGGYEEAVVDRWLEDTTAELAEPRIHVFSEWISAWCVRSASEWKPRAAE